MISCLTLFSSTPSRSWSCPSRDRWRTRGWWSCTNHPQHSVCTWLPWRTWSAESPLCRYFWLEDRTWFQMQCGGPLVVNSVCTARLCIYWYILVCPILTTVSLKLRLYCVIFILGRVMCCTMHWIGIIWCRNIIKLCPCMKKDMISNHSIYVDVPYLIICFIIYWYMHKYEVYPSL